jgi:hypothetical protein
MADDGFVQVEPDSTGKMVDTSQITTSEGTVQRQRVAIGDSNTAENFANVTGAGALQVDGSGVTQPVSGIVVAQGPVQTGNTPSFATVGVSSSLVLAANSSRTSAILTNTSTATIYLSFGANAAVVGSGIPLFPQGSLVLSSQDNVQQAINAIATASSSNLGIQEFV